MSDKYLRSDKEHLLQSIGTEVCWGWSPAVDFVALLDNSDCNPTPKSGQTPAAASSAPAAVTADTGDANFDALLAKLSLQKQHQQRGEGPSAVPDSNGPDDVHLLLAGGCDVRHILRTLSTLRLREAERKNVSDAGGDSQLPTYHFYLYEPNLRTHCRHLFFVQWLLDSMFSLEDLEERVLMFLEAFGNLCVRERTAAQIRKVVQGLLRGLEKEDGVWGSLVSFSDMKLKEKDFIETQLTHWSKDSSVADVEQQWSQRVRHDMAERFDNRDNLIDWDFVFKLTDYTNLLKFPEYRVWRNTGVAFDVCHINPRKGFEYNYNIPNKTLCLFSRQGKGTYHGDIKNGPFFAIGAQTDNEFIRHRTADSTCKYGNGVVAMHNVRAWLFSLMTGLPWPWSDHAFAWDDPKNYNYLPPGTPAGVAYAAVFPHVKFHFMGLDFERFLLHARNQKLRMDAAFFGTSCTHLLNARVFQELMLPGGVVVAETAKFVVNAEENAKEAYVQKIKELAKAGGWSMDPTATAKLHEGQPKPKSIDGALTKQQELTLRRYEMPYQVVLRHGPA